MASLAPLLLALLAQEPPAPSAAPFDWPAATRKDLARIWKSEKAEDRTFVRSFEEPIDSLEKDLASLRADLLGRKYAARFLGAEKKEAFDELFEAIRPLAYPDREALRALGPEARSALAEMLHDPVLRCAEDLLGVGSLHARLYRDTLRTIALFPDTRIVVAPEQVAELLSRMALLAPEIERAAADAKALAGFPPEARAAAAPVAKMLEAANASGVAADRELAFLAEEAERKAEPLREGLRLTPFLNEKADEVEALRQRLARAEEKHREAARYLPPDRGQKAPPPDPEVAKMRVHERWKITIEILVEVVRLDPTSTWALYDLARANDFRKSVGEAISCFERFIELYDPDGKKNDGYSKAVRDYVRQHRQLGH